MSSYTQKRFPDDFLSAVCGTPKSLKISCAERLSEVSFQILKTLSTHRLIFVPASSGKSGFIRRWSRPILRPSFVIIGILSSVGATLRSLISFARSPSAKIRSFCVSVGCAIIVDVIHLGILRLSISAVFISAHSLNNDISSGILLNFANLVLSW